MMSDFLSTLDYVPRSDWMIFSAVLGLFIGSFLNVVSDRYLTNESIVWPPSHCTECGHRLRIWELIPVVSWVCLRGKCFSCGVVFSSIFIVYDLGSIAYTFFITAGVFGAMSVYGMVTKNDMTKFGSYCIMGLFGLIIASVVNIFVANSTLDWIISLFGVALFIGLTAWDTQKIKNAAYVTDPSQTGKLATIGALSLYLDFINLFLYLLRIFGGRSND